MLILEYFQSICQILACFTFTAISIQSFSNFYATQWNMLSSEMICKCGIPGQGMLFEHHCKCFSSSCCLRFQRSSFNTGYEDTLIIHAQVGRGAKFPDGVQMFSFLFSFFFSCKLDIEKRKPTESPAYTILCRAPRCQRAGQSDWRTAI